MGNAHAVVDATTWLQVTHGRWRMVTFENLQHDYPKRIIYRREGDDVLHARTEGDVNDRIEEFTWRRAK